MRFCHFGQLTFVAPVDSYGIALLCQWAQLVQYLVVTALNWSLSLSLSLTALPYIIEMHSYLVESSFFSTCMAVKIILSI